MSDEKITIEISVEDAVEFAKYTSLNPNADSYVRFCEQCKAGVDARKSKYEKWQGFRRLPWRQGEQSECLKVFDNTFLKMPSNGDDAKLVAAAPQMLDACIKVFRFIKGVKGNSVSYDTLVNIIRAALPDDVADEVLK